MFQIALFKGFPNIPHIPPPSGHSAGTNDATMAPTPENAPCWHEIGRPQEIWYSLIGHAFLACLHSVHFAMCSPLTYTMMLRHCAFGANFSVTEPQFSPITCHLKTLPCVQTLKHAGAVVSVMTSSKPHQPRDLPSTGPNIKPMSCQIQSLSQQAEKAHGSSNKAQSAATDNLPTHLEFATDWPWSEVWLLLLVEE